VSDRARAVLLAALCLGVFLTGLELLVTAVALPSIINDLGGWTRLREASWIVNGYFVASVATMPLAGRAADRFGVPGLFMGSLLLFAVGSALAGAAQGFEWLVAARVLQGIGGGAVVPLATAGASHLYGGHARARALGLVGGLTFLGMAAGPWFGATVLDTLDLRGVAGPLAAGGPALLVPAWRWCFYLVTPFALLAGVYTWAAAPAWRATRRSTPLDLPGALLFTAALALALATLAELGQAEALGLAGATLVLGIAAGLRLWRAPVPFLELRAYRDRVFASATLVSLLTGYALATALVGAGVFVDRVRYGGPDQQRLVLGTLALAMAIGALASGFGLRRLGLRRLSLAGLLLGAGALAAVAGVGPTTPLPVVVAVFSAFGVGFGLTVTPRSSAAVEALGATAYGAASAAVTVARFVGMAAGVAVLTDLGTQRIEALSSVLTDQAARDAVLPVALRGHSLQDPFVVDVLEHWAAGQAQQILAGIFLFAALVLLVALAPALLMRAGSPSRRAEPPESATLPGAS
jgi:MFS family permease